MLQESGLPTMSQFTEDPTRQQPSRIRRAQRDRAAFLEVYDAYGARILTFITRRVIDVETAFDLHQEVFAIALERRAQFRGTTIAEDEGWLFAIARGELSRYWKRGKVARDALGRLSMERQELTDDSIERIADLAELDDLRPALASALDRLGADQREAVQLHVVEGLGYEEISQRLGVSRDVVRARVSRGLRTLAKALGHDQEEGNA